MPRVQYVGPHDEVEVPSLRVAVERGGEVDVPAAAAKALLEQPDNWQPAKPKRSKP